MTLCRVMAGRALHTTTSTGVNDYVKLALEFAYGADSPALKEKRVAGVQTISGTGACRLAGDFYARFLGKGSPLYLPNPTW